MGGGCELLVDTATTAMTLPVESARAECEVSGSSAGGKPRRNHVSVGLRVKATGKNPARVPK